MPQANVIRWRDGAGWLVLSGGAADDGLDVGDVEASALAHVRPGAPLAYIWAASDIETADQHLDALQDLGAPTGYLVDVLTEDDDTLRQQLSVAGLIILGDGPNVKALRSGLLGAALEGVGEAYDSGAVIVALGQCAPLLGLTVLARDDEGELAGVGWVEDAIIVPRYEQDGEPARLAEALRKTASAYGLGIATGSALALGPEGQVEAWGEQRVTVTLGRKVKP